MIFQVWYSAHRQFNGSEAMKFFKRTDIIIIAILLAVSVLGWYLYTDLFKGKPVKAEIYHYSKLVHTEILGEGDKVFSLPNNKNVVFHANNGKIWFEASDCPDKICVHTGKLETAGQSASCIPNGFTIKIVPINKNTENPDIVIGK
jgi:hypothetical protein